jgi:hypothetical protein
MGADACKPFVPVISHSPLGLSSGPRKVRLELFFKRSTGQACQPPRPLLLHFPVRAADSVILHAPA